MNREKMMKALADKWGFECATTEEFNGVEHGIWIRSSEETEIEIKGVNYMAFDYWAYEWDFKEKFYTMNVLNIVRDFVQKHGWFVSCHDPGTYMMYEV